MQKQGGARLFLAATFGIYWLFWSGLRLSGSAGAPDERVFGEEPRQEDMVAEAPGSEGHHEPSGRPAPGWRACLSSVLQAGQGHEAFSLVEATVLAEGHGDRARPQNSEDQRSHLVSQVWRVGHPSAQ